MPEAKPRDTNIPRVLLLLVNDSPNLLVPKAMLRNTNNISYYYFYSANVPNHLLISYSDYCNFGHLEQCMCFILLVVIYDLDVEIVEDYKCPAVNIIVAHTSLRTPCSDI